MLAVIVRFIFADAGRWLKRRRAFVLDSVNCAVCGKRLKRNVIEPLLWDAHATIKYLGQEYFLCCPQCLEAFECNPSKYAHPEGQSGELDAP